MAGVDLAQPDVTLLLDMGGVIREASVSSILSSESVDAWLGHSWKDTVPDLVGDKVGRIIKDARDSGISAFRQLTQRFPSGREIPIEYTTVLLGGRAGLLAVGKSLVAVAELQSRFIAAQQSLEREYWKLREVETRYRLLFNHSSEAVLLVLAGTCRIVEANPAAVHALGLKPATQEAGAGQDLIAFLPAAERPSFRAMIQRVIEQGKTPGTLIHLGDERKPWLARASSVKGAEPGPFLMVQLVPTGASIVPAGREAVPSAEATVEHLPDGFVVLDADGVIRRANPAFAGMVDMASAASVVGERLDRWVWRPGADVPVLLSTLRDHKVARLFPSALHSELGTEMEIEISGTGLPESDPRYFGLLIRDVGRRVSHERESAERGSLVEQVAEPVGKVPLRQLIKSTVDSVERHYVKAALDLAGGNRTAAAELLGLSRQSLYMKLGRYGFDEDLASVGPRDGRPESD